MTERSNAALQRFAALALISRRCGIPVRPSQHTAVRELLSWLGSRPVLLHLVPGVVALRIRSSPKSLRCQARICAFGSEPDVDHPGATYELGRAAADKHAWAGSGP